MEKGDDIKNNKTKQIDKETLKNWTKDKKILTSKKDLCLAIVTEYPTHDQLELDIEFI